MKPPGPTPDSRVSVFMAGDAAQLIRDAVLDSLNGLGTGSLRESFDKVVAGGGRFYVSGMSKQGPRGQRGGPRGQAGGVRDALAMVQLAFEADRVLTYCATMGPASFRADLSRRGLSTAAGD